MRKDKGEAEFLQILNQYRGTIYKVCLLYTDRTPDAVEELFQDICCNLWVAFKRFHQESSACTWVYSVAYRTAMHQMRWRLRQPRFIQLDPKVYETVAEEGEDEEVQWLYELMGRLPDEEQALLLMYIDRMTQSEIAQTLGTTEDVVNRKINRLKEKLKQMYDEENKQ